ncbi:hypothetical protein, unlikely [Trypanosoma brucei brucei TREU927]|uniref:Uncharacterized protein n=1 Tax=Trypanosoma brucei brucei (strain 927/4 GUTat10.1) TaxID=185431 RepID=Q8IFH7_TRYB2|nr:hypothetical protein, unlikely [Trypanosoma brucei brucei TREU927]CAD53031.1 hypothetical protein, unlikely [Trypanosoma brucei brucei TREU927]
MPFTSIPISDVSRHPLQLVHVTHHLHSPTQHSYTERIHPHFVKIGQYSLTHDFSQPCFHTFTSYIITSIRRVYDHCEPFLQFLYMQFHQGLLPLHEAVHH